MFVTVSSRSEKTRDTEYVEELVRSFTRVLFILQVGYYMMRFLKGIVTVAVDLLVDCIICSVWLRMRLTGEERGQRSDRLVKAACEDGAEKMRGD